MLEPARPLGALALGAVLQAALGGDRGLDLRLAIRARALVGRGAALLDDPARVPLGLGGLVTSARGGAGLAVDRLARGVGLGDLGLRGLDGVERGLLGARGLTSTCATSASRRLRSLSTRSCAAGRDLPQLARPRRPHAPVLGDRDAGERGVEPVDRLDDPDVLEDGRGKTKCGVVAGGLDVGGEGLGAVGGRRGTRAAGGARRASAAGGGAPTRGGGGRAGGGAPSRGGGGRAGRRRPQPSAAAGEPAAGVADAASALRHDQRGGAVLAAPRQQLRARLEVQRHARAQARAERRGQRELVARGRGQRVRQRFRAARGAGVGAQELVDLRELGADAGGLAAGLLGGDVQLAAGAAGGLGDGFALRTASRGGLGDARSSPRAPGSRPRGPARARRARVRGARGGPRPARRAPSGARRCAPRCRRRRCRPRSRPASAAIPPSRRLARSSSSPIRRCAASRRMPIRSPDERAE